MGLRFCTLALAATAALGAAVPSAAASTTGGVAPTPLPSGGVKAGSVTPPPKPPAPKPQPKTWPGPVVSGSRAVLRGGVAYAPTQAPNVVKRVIWAANKIRHTPYKWGGGHGTWNDTGYDCSGSVSYALHGAGLLSSPLVSGAFMSWGSAGPGRWITVYATAGHAYMIVAGLRFDTSGAGERGPRWRPEAPWERGFTARHPSGL